MIIAERMRVCTAVREDRTPGGKHRAKKLRGDESDMSTIMVGPAVMDWNGSEQDEMLLSRLVDSKPEAENTIEGMPGRFSALLLQTNVCVSVYICPSINQSICPFV